MRNKHHSCEFTVKEFEDENLSFPQNHVFYRKQDKGEIKLTYFQNDCV